MSSQLGLTDYQFYFGPAGGSGFYFGQGYNVDVMEIQGITDLEVLFSDQQHLLQFGDIPGIHLAVGKVVRFELEIRKGNLTWTQWRNLISTTESAFTVLRDEEHELHWKLPGESERFLRGRPVRRRRIIDPDSELGIAAIEVELRQADPRSYIAAKRVTPNRSGTFTLNVGSKERVWPLIRFNTGAGNTRARLVHNNTGVVLDVIDGYGVNAFGYANMDAYIRGLQDHIIYDHNGDGKYGAWQPPREPFYLEPGNNSLTLLWSPTCRLEWWDTFL